MTEKLKQTLKALDDALKPTIIFTMKATLAHIYRYKMEVAILSHPDLMVELAGSQDVSELKFQNKIINESMDSMETIYYFSILENLVENIERICYNVKPNIIEYRGSFSLGQVLKFEDKEHLLHDVIKETIRKRSIKRLSSRILEILTHMKIETNDLQSKLEWLEKMRNHLIHEENSGYFEDHPRSLRFTFFPHEIENKERFRKESSKIITDTIIILFTACENFIYENIAMDESFDRTHIKVMLSRLKRFAYGEQMNNEPD